MFILYLTDRMERKMKFVTYEEFGAVGDGFADDFAAIKRAHDYANENGLPVKAAPGAKYYIKDTRIDGKVEKIIIKTDTVWDDADFIIDDRDIDFFTHREMATSHVFKVESDYAMRRIEEREILDKLLSAGLNRESSKIDLGLGYPALIIPYNKTEGVYRRRATSGFEGRPMHEVILLDKDGSISPETPIIFNYTYLDYVEVYRTDIKPITIKGGTVTTRACRVNARTYPNGVKRDAGYYFRGIDVCRSYTTVDGLKHYVTDEITPKEYVLENLCGPEYYGFFVGSNATNITFKNCIMTGRRYYHLEGTYDFTAMNVNKIVLDGCVQHNFWVKYDEKTDTVSPASRDEEGAVTSMCWPTVEGKRFKLYWGIGGTNFCKNMEYYNSTLSRFDAHAGLYNGKIINCTVNFMSITGNGDFIVKDTVLYSEGTGKHSAAMFYLRGDYGSTWEGKITAENFNAYVYTTDKSSLFYHAYGNWYYGYKCFIPSISINNFRLFDIDTKEPLPDDYAINLFPEEQTIFKEPAMHLESTYATYPFMPYVDKDGDGIVDGTNVPYCKEKLRENYCGIELTDSNENLNIVTPPEYIKLTDAKSYVINVPKTYSAERGIPDINGNENEGFFGSTKFIWGEGEDEYCQGTNHENTKNFKFNEF